MNSSTLLLGFWLVLDMGRAATLIPVPYDSQNSCARAAGIARYNYSKSENGDGLTQVWYNCVPDQEELSKGNVK